MSFGKPRRVLHRHAPALPAAPQRTVDPARDRVPACPVSHAHARSPRGTQGEQGSVASIAHRPVNISACEHCAFFLPPMLRGRNWGDCFTALWTEWASKQPISLERQADGGRRCTNARCCSERLNRTAKRLAQSSSSPLFSTSVMGTRGCVDSQWWSTRLYCSCRPCALRCCCLP